MKLYRYLVLFLLLACSTDDPVATNGNLIGRVTDVVTSEPISGALVSFKGNSLSTGADGTFSFTEVTQIHTLYLFQKQATNRILGK